MLTYSLALVLAPAMGTTLFAWSPTGLWLTCAALSVVSAGLVVRSSGGPY